MKILFLADFLVLGFHKIADFVKRENCTLSSFNVAKVFLAIVSFGHKIMNL